MVLKSGPGIIPAFDLNLGQAIIYGHRLRGLDREITGLKIGSEIIDEFGYNNARPLFEQAEISYPWIVDMQKRGTDVPEFIKRQINMAKKYKVGIYIGSPLGAGSRSGKTEKEYGSLEALVKSCQANEIEPIVVLEMTQPGANYFLREGANEDLARLAKDLGVRCFVAPANKPERIKVYRNVVGEDARIVSPGVGPQNTGDAIADAADAIYAGADDLVIGRALSTAKDPVDLARRLYEKMLDAWEKRKSIR